MEATKGISFSNPNLITIEVNSLFDLEECLTIKDKTSSIFIDNVVLTDHILKTKNTFFTIAIKHIYIYKNSTYTSKSTNVCISTCTN